jgi:hypothetical protein
MVSYLFNKRRTTNGGEESTDALTVDTAFQTSGKEAGRDCPISTQCIPFPDYKSHQGWQLKQSEHIFLHIGGGRHIITVICEIDLPTSCRRDDLSRRLSLLLLVEEENPIKFGSLLVLLLAPRPLKACWDRRGALLYG